MLYLASLLLLLLSQMNIIVPRPVRTCRRLKRNIGWWHTEVVHAPWACIFRALKARDNIYIFAALLVILLPNKLCAHEKLKIYLFNVFVMYALNSAHETVRRVK